MPPRETGKVHIALLRPCLSEFVVGLAERGQRQVEEPPFGLDQFGFDSYVDPDLFRVAFDEM
jgi:hypothetical protein